MADTWVSGCCSAPLTVAGDTTQHYECEACGKACDREPDDECDGADHPTG